MADIHEYLQNWINVRAESAAQKLVEAETSRLLNDPSISTMPASKEELVMNSPLKNVWDPYEEDCEDCTFPETTAVNESEVTN